MSWKILGLIIAVIQKDAEVDEQSRLISTDEVIGVTSIFDGNGGFCQVFALAGYADPYCSFGEGKRVCTALSDLHVGSKYFMVDAWQRFLQRLSGEVDDPSGLASQCSTW